MEIDVRSLDAFHGFGAVHAVRAATLRVERGEALGLIGPNGAGKSTLLACILGLRRASRGSVRVDGDPPDALRVKARCGSLSERPAFPAGMSARRVLSFHRGLLGRTPPKGHDVEDVLARVGMEPHARRLPAAFSHGMRQRLGLATALLGAPELLVLDEPAAGLDPPGIALLREVVREATERGATVLLSSHQLDEVERTCTRVAFMRGGSIIGVHALAGLSTGRRVVRLRFGVDPAPWSRSAAHHGRVVERSEERELRVEVESDDAAAALLRRLVAEGAPVLEAVPEATRLERLFRGDGA